ncbi:MAG: hypothetical protein U9M92_01165 [Patescibacteria group bacterium]|nr:hypothetical protein [Patescibacteria group bacterium]
MERTQNVLLVLRLGGLLGLAIGIAIFGIEPTIALPVLVGAALGLLWNFKREPQQILQLTK